MNGIILELPGDPPIAAGVDHIGAALAAEFDGEYLSRSRPPAVRGDSFEARDDVAAYLIEHGLVLDEGRDGALFVACPWAAGHSSDSGITEAAWFPAGTGGFEQGHYRCLHASCAARSDDDFLEAVGCGASADFEALPVEADGESLPAARVLDPKNAMMLGEGTLKGAFRKGEHFTLVRHGGLWYEYAGVAYRERTEEEIRGRVWCFLDTCKKEVVVEDKAKKTKRKTIVPFNPTTANVNAAMDAMRSFIGAGDTLVPGWLPGSMGAEPREMAPLLDGLLHVPSRRLHPLTPGLFTLNALPFAWNGATAAPRAWLDFLEDILPGDDEAKGTMQEMFGYLLTPDTSQQKMFMVIGPRRCGKGTIGRVLGALLGPQNVVSPQLSQLTGEFGLQPLIGKLLALFPDARAGSGPSFNSPAVVERLLMTSGEDSMTINRKGTTMWTGSLVSRVLILANEAPRLGDASGALPGRFITLAIRPSFFGKEDVGLFTRLKAELPAIFRWALDGRDRLAARGHFLQPASGRSITEELYDLGSPLVGFARDCLDFEANETTLIDDLFETWNWWAGNNGHHEGSKAVFSRNLRTAFPRIAEAHIGPRGAQKPARRGVCIKPHVQAERAIF